MYMRFILCAFHLTILAVSASPLSLAGQAQWPLYGSRSGQSASEVRQRLTRQSEDICRAGSSQWTGTVPLGEDRDMFFCGSLEDQYLCSWLTGKGYFESRADPETAPLIIWLNGGPGASSLLGAFHEIGPCTVTKDGNDTVRNDRSWTNFANMLFIDQPIGVGFSEPFPQNTSVWPSNLIESGIDFDKFLDIFLDELFPALKKGPVHFAGESYGGQYLPVYASITRRRFTSIILVDALVSFAANTLGTYEHLCINRWGNTTENRLPINATACAIMETTYPICDKFGSLCDATYDPEVCFTAVEKCAPIGDFLAALVQSGEFDPYDDRLTCEDPPICGHMGMEEVELYLNSSNVKSALGFPSSFDYKVVNFDFNVKWMAGGQAFVPKTRELIDILDNKHTPILVLNGQNDIAVNTEGVLHVYDNLQWSGQAKFRTKELEPWYYKSLDGNVVTGGLVKSGGNLTVVAIDNAGHMSPHDQPVGVGQVLQRWIAGGYRPR
ncbi:uncharacterized protein JN550_004589 [Neoarthrinium moseri]|uniref:uncharacterized protein n=1 Tax=Neoarthrinium moseri TaxID=1658444 RepID=UPI001FDCD95C|nr:uncharacterized protein JN550_004589 [Neoarthrinium moseri]KAI1871595.1 hypothetical protein JN550_004589 [Neoarthrinium moseri]